MNYKTYSTVFPKQIGPGDHGDDSLKKFFLPDIRAVFTDDSCDFVLPEKAEGLSLEQKNFLKKTYQIDPQKVFAMRQVHADKILTVGKNDLPQKGDLPQADGIMTNEPGIILSVRTADCVPVFLYDPKQKCIGLVHAGWKSSALRIVEKAVAILNKNYGSLAEDLWVALGPAIGRCCYEVSQDLEKVFPKETIFFQNKRFLDLPAVNKNQLLTAGVRAQNIFDTSACTVCGQGFFSYRRDKDKAGRHLSLMWICE